jgi:hypothetical protein
MVDIDTGRRGTCHAGPIPPRLQQQIRGITGPHVVFTDRVPPPTLDAAVVRLGTITFERRRALVAIDSSCGPLCGSGQTDIVVRRGAAWEVVGTTGLSWIS